MKNKNQFLRKIGIAFSSKQRLRILKILSRGNSSISKLQRELKIGYKSVWNHVRILEIAGLVKTNQELEGKRGSIVYVSLVEPSTIKSVRDAFLTAFMPPIVKGNKERILGILNLANKELSINELSKFAGIGEPTVEELLESLKFDGMVEMKKTVKITSKGKKSIKV